jgi:hypothetical protein
VQLDQIMAGVRGSAAFQDGVLVPALRACWRLRAEPRATWRGRSSSSQTTPATWMRRRSWRRGHRFPRRGPIDIRFGQVWRPPTDLGPAEIVLELETRVKELLK